MQMDRGMDTGDILNQMECTIEPSETSQALHDRLAQTGAELLVKTLDQLERGRVVPIKQDDSQATYADKISKSEAELDWCLTAESLANQVRAFNPWPVAYTHFQDQRLRIWQAVFVNESSLLEPGTLVDVNQDGLDIATGEGILRVLMVQLPGGRALSIADFLNAHQKDLIPGITQFIN